MTPITHQLINLLSSFSSRVLTRPQLYLHIILSDFDNRLNLLVFVPEIMHRGDTVCLHVCAGACGVGKPPVLGGDVLPGCAGPDTPALPTAIRRTSHA